MNYRDELAKEMGYTICPLRIYTYVCCDENCENCKEYIEFKQYYEGNKKVRKEAGRVNEDEIRKRIEVLEIRKNGYLEVGNTNQVRKIENEIHKWEDLLERINGRLEKKVEKLENFIKSKDLWESYLHF